VTTCEVERIDADRWVIKHLSRSVTRGAHCALSSARQHSPDSLSLIQADSWAIHRRLQLSLRRHRADKAPITHAGWDKRVATSQTRISKPSGRISKNLVLRLDRAFCTRPRLTRARCAPKSTKHRQSETWGGEKERAYTGDRGV